MRVHYKTLGRAKIADHYELADDEFLFEFKPDSRMTSAASYYVVARDKNEAKRRFKQVFTWMDYEYIHQCDGLETGELLNNPGANIII